MRWFKHLTTANNDAAVSAILEEFGPAGYGVWWLILDSTTGSMDKGSKATSAIHSEVNWGAICYSSSRKFRSIAKRLEEKKLIVCCGPGTADPFPYVPLFPRFEVEESPATEVSAT